jgi:hypothetical protein
MTKRTGEEYELAPIKLWSPLQRQLAATGQTKGTPQQWIGTIRNLQKNGVTAVEIEWSSIIPELEKHPAHLLHIDELLAFLKHDPPCELVLQRHVTDEYLPLVRYEKQQRPAELPPTVVRRGLREARLLHYADRTFGLCIWLHVEVDTGLFGRNRYWSFSVPRGRKKLASHPVERRFASAQEAMAYGRILVERMARRLATEGFVGQTRSLNHFTRYVLPGGENYTEWLITAPNLSAEYWGPHFDIPNIVAHVRSTERMTPAGARLLVLEEIQSDWNQELRAAIQEARRRRPVDDAASDSFDWDDDLQPPPFNPYLNHWLEAALRMMLLLAANQGFSGIAWLPGRLHAERFPWANADGLKAFYDRIVPAAVEKLVRSWGAQLAEAQFPTLSRNFEVRRVAGTKKWKVLNREAVRFSDEEFLDEDAAEVFRRSKEVPVAEKITAVYLSDEMRVDIRQHGLPYLGAVGQRQVAKVRRSEGSTG